MEGAADTSGSKSQNQAIASTTSFFQRYTLLMAVGVAPKNVDDDARGGVGPRELDAAIKSDYAAQIEALADMKHAEALWQTIATECTKAGDVPAYDELKAAMAAKRKALKTAQKAEV